MTNQARTAAAPPPAAGGEPPGQETRIAGLSDRHIAYLLLFTAPAMFATNMLVARWMGDTAPPVALAFWRWFGTFLLMLTIRGPKLWQHRRDVIAEWKDLSILGALGMGVCGAFVYIGAQTSAATNIGLLFSSAPVIIVVVAWRFYGESLRPIQVVGGLTCLAGVLWIIARGNPQNLIDLNFAIGDMWIMAAAIGWAFYVVLLKYRPSAMGMMTRFTAITLYGTIILLPFYIWESLAVKPMPVTADTGLAVALLVFIAGFGAYQAYGKVQAVLGAARGSLILYLGPVYIGVMAWIILGEALQPWHYVGAALVLPGIWLANRPAKPAPLQNAAKARDS